MSELSREEQLEYILEHYEHPHNHGSLPDADAQAQGGNPGCGDIVNVYIKVREGHIAQVSFEGEGCTISQAAASITTEHAKNLTLDEIAELDHSFLIDELGEEALSMRPRCATLGLETLKRAAQDYLHKTR
jgi:nitrogen fixation NifU-like protein